VEFNSPHMPKRPVQTPITDQEIAFAHLILAGKLTDREAAEAVGISPGQAYYVKAKPRVKEYMASHRASVRAGLVQHEVEALAKFNISREQILAKWWEFANIDPAKGYNTSSQSKALELLWKGMGYTDGNSDPKKPEGVDEPKPQIYRATWMRKPGDPDYEEDDGETARSRETSTRREPVMSDPEPPLKSVGPAAPQSPAVRSPINRLVEPTGPSRWVPGAGFGRFEGPGG
jgi:hypothetical protein